MSEAEQPLDITSFFQEAQDFIRSIASNAHLASALMDDWHSDSRKKGARVIYSNSCRDGCISNCDECLLVKLVGVDNELEENGLHTSLCKIAQRHRDLFSMAKPGIDLGQAYLNCKTLHQYEEAFVLFAIHRCLSWEELDSELRWVLGYRILYIDGCFDLAKLKMQEFQSKQRIISEIFSRIDDRDKYRKQQVEAFAKLHGFKL